MLTVAYSFRVNKALAAMGINPSSIKAGPRSAISDDAKRVGLTPEEAALVIAGMSYGISVPEDVDVAIGVWKRDGKINLQKPEIVRAFSDMGYKTD